jgi:hypothetical protein
MIVYLLNTVTMYRVAALSQSLVSVPHIYGDQVVERISVPDIYGAQVSEERIL